MFNDDSTTDDLMKMAIKNATEAAKDGVHSSVFVEMHIQGAVEAINKTFDENDTANDHAARERAMYFFGAFHAFSSVKVFMELSIKMLKETVSNSLGEAVDDDKLMDELKEILNTSLTDSDDTTIH